MAQFEIARDGGRSEVETASGSGGRGSRSTLSRQAPSMRWCRSAATRLRADVAERPATAAQLRAGAAQLSQALSKADFGPAIS